MMGFPSISHSISISLLLALIVSSLINEHDAHGLDKMPSIWGTGEDGHGQNEQSYRFMAEVRVIDTGKMFMFEEWASGESGKFRLDIVNPTTGIKETLLAYQQSGEYFHYSPFECRTETEFTGIPIDDLGDKFPKLTGSFIPTGIGGLWLHAIQAEAHLNPGIDPIQESSGTNKTQKRTLANFFQYHDIFVDRPTFDWPWRVSFYFDDKLHDPNSISYIVSFKDKAIMRINLLEVSIPYKKEVGGEDLEDLFRLPIGYGCKRSPTYDKFLAAVPNYLRDGTAPQVIGLSIVSYRPIDLAHDLEKWKSHATQVRLAFGRLGLSRKDYLVMETEDYAPESESAQLFGSGLRKAKLRRIKQVWDLGTSGKSQSALKIDQTLANYYKMDKRTGECLEMGENRLDKGSSIEIPIEFSRRQSAANSTLNLEDPFKSGIPLTTGMIYNLLVDTEDYHLLQEKDSAFDSRVKEFVYESRRRNMEVRNKRGEVILNNQVSLIRSQSMYILGKFDDKPLAVDHGLKLEVHFLSKDGRQLLGKLYVEVNEKRMVNWADFHRELNVQPCFDRLNMGSASRGDYMAQFDRAQPLGYDFVLNYPIESAQLAGRIALSDLVNKRALRFFLMNLYSISNSSLDMLQLVNVDQRISPEMLKFSGRLLERPSLLAYTRIEGRKFARSKLGSLFTELRRSDELCAETCSHYTCSMFAYSEQTRICDLLLATDGQLGQQQLNQSTNYLERVSAFIEDDPNYDFFYPRPDAQPGVNPRQFLHELREFIVGQLKTDTKPGPLEPRLTLKLSYFSDDEQEIGVDLEPSSIESGALIDADLEDLIEEANDEEPKDQQVTTKVRPTAAANQDDSLTPVRPEYGVIFVGHKFSSQSIKIGATEFPLPLATHHTYEQCESLCNELDCKSFAHCQLENTCMVSNLHETQQIQGYLEKQDLCFVLARDYLSKFQHNARVSLQTSRPPRSARKLLEVASSRDCASKCMDESSFKCRAFYYCADRRACYLRKSHLMISERRRWALASDGSVVIATNNDQSADSTSTSTSCEVYTRSFLAEFDKFTRKALPELDDGLSVFITGSLGAESCAVECAERPGECQAFHVCRAETSIRPVCVLRMLDKNEPPARKWTVQSMINQLTDNDRCTTFIVSSGSELSSPKEANFEPVSTDLNEDQLGSEKIGASSHWFAAICFLLIGMAVGYLLVLVIGLHQ